MRDYADEVAKLRTLSTLGEVVPKLLNNLGLTPEKYGILALMDKEVSNLGIGAKIVGLKGKFLYIEVESPAQYSEISLRKREILKPIRAVDPDLHSQIQIKIILKGNSVKQ